MKVTKIVQKHFLCTFWGFLVTIICDVKIDVKMCEPHYVNLFFLWTSSIVYVFDFLTFDIFLTIWHLFDNFTSFWHFDISFNLNHLSPSQGYFLLLYSKIFLASLPLASILSSYALHICDMCINEHKACRGVSWPFGLEWNLDELGSIQNMGSTRFAPFSS